MQFSSPKMNQIQNFAGLPLGELTALLQTPSWWGGGSLPLPKNPSPLSALRASTPRTQHTHILFRGAAYAADWAHQPSPEVSRL